jgi:hypothetical protein
MATAEGRDVMGAREYWIVVEPDGRLRLHAENDGWTYLRKGPQAADIYITEAELKATYPVLYDELRASGGRNTARVIYQR